MALLRRLAGIAAMLLLAAMPMARGSASGQPTGPSQQPDCSATVRLPGHVLPALAQATLMVSAADADQQPLNLTVVLRRDDEDGFQAFLAGVSDPGSPNYGQTLTQAQIADRFGPSQASYDAVQVSMQQQGFVLTLGSANRLTQTWAGTRGLAQTAFALTIGDYQLNGQDFYASDQDPAVPACVAPLIQAIVGLDDLGRPQPNAAISNR